MTQAPERAVVGALAHRSRRGLLLAVAGVASLLVFVVYGVAVRRRWGQRIDATAVAGRHVLSRRAIRVAAELHGWISVASLVLLGGAIVLVALARGRPRLGLGAGLLIAGSLLTTEALKRVLTRPDFGLPVVMPRHASYPSGHTTIAMGLGVAAMLVAPRRYRAAVAVAGAAFASVIGCSMLVTASHRPSDMVGAALVVTAWSAVVAAVLVRSTPVRASAARPTWLRASPWLALGGVMLLTVAFVGVAAIAVAIHYGRLETVSVGRAFVEASAAIVGTIVTCTAALLITLGDTELDRAATPEP